MSAQASRVPGELPYEYVAGRNVRLDWANREQVPVPPKAIREALRLPARYEFACLAPEMQDDYVREILITAGTYVEEWPVAGKHGRWAALFGESGVGKTFAAAAIANEITRIYYPVHGFDVHWFSTSWSMQSLLDLRRFVRGEEYFSARKRLFKCDLLIIDDLLHVADKPEAKEMLFAALDYRDQHMKPVIITSNAVVNPGGGDWGPVERAFNGPFARRLGKNAKGFMSVV